MELNLDEYVKEWTELSNEYKSLEVGIFLTHYFGARTIVIFTDCRLQTPPIWIFSKIWRYSRSNVRSK